MLMNRRTIDIIENAVTVPDVLRLHGITRRGNRCQCPIHHGKRDSFSFTDKLWHCFNCGAGGGVIQLEALLDGVDEDTACQTLARQFGLDINRPKWTKQDKLDWFYQKQLDEEYDGYMREQKNYYRRLSNLYRNVKDVPELAELAESLENWLDENIDGVVQPWIYQSIQ